MSDFTDLTPELDRIEARARARSWVDLQLTNLPGLDERPMAEQIRDGVAQLIRCMELFEDADDVADVMNLYALTWTHRYGPDWPEQDEALAVLGRYEDAHDTMTPAVVDRFGIEVTAMNHTRAFYRDVPLLAEHLTAAHGFADAGQWPVSRLLAGHANVHHVLPVGAS